MAKQRIADEDLDGHGNVSKTGEDGDTYDYYHNEEVVGTTGSGGQQANIHADGGGDPQNALEAYRLLLEDIAERRGEAVDNLEGDLSQLEGSAHGADLADNYALKEYLGEMDKHGDPLEAAGYVGDVESEAAGAEADGLSIDAQYDALDRFKDLSSTEVTAEERFMYEQQRVAEERDRSAAMDAALRDLEARGARSGGAEIAALTGAQDITSQNRLLGDLGTQANAQKRAMLATQGYADTAGQIRDSSFNEDYMRGSATDDASQFNAKMMADWNMWSDDFGQKERDRAVDRADSTRGARNDVVDRGFGREGMLYNEKEDATALRIGNEGARGTGSESYTRLLMGDKAADKAAEALEEDDFNVFKPDTWF